MNSFDLMIERYKKELVDAKRRSIEKELADTANEKTVASEPEEENNISAFDEKEKLAPVNAAFEKASGERLGFLSSEEAIVKDSENSVKNAVNGGESDAEKKEKQTDSASKAGKEQASFQSESDDLQNENLDFDENEPYPESLGALKVQVFMANRAYPVSSAHVVIAGKESRKVYFDGYTNTSGIVGSILLPAPKKAFSQSPQETPPYSQYDILVRHPKFQSRKYIGVPVFSGVESIQNIQLLPLGTDDEDNTDVTESEPNGLLMKGGESNG